MDLNKDVKYIKGVGPNRVKLLNKIGIFTLKDLITYYPRDYEDRSKPKNLYECADGEEVLIEAMAAGKISEMHKGKMTISRLIVKNSYIKLEAEQSTSSFFKILENYYKNYFVCDFENQNYFFLSDIKTLV